ncbi:MAG: C39 family peptidase [Candidatus Shapirobacteria bacterium]
MKLFRFGLLLTLSILLTGCTQANLSSPTLLNTPTPLQPAPTSSSISLPSIIPTVSALPSSHLIDTFFVPQAPQKNWDQPWQDACEEAALLTVHYYYQSQNPSIDQMVVDYQNIFDFETRQGWGHDVNLSQLSSVADSLGYQSSIIANPTIDQIKSYISQNIPIIVPANGKTLYRENKHFKSGGPWYHQIVILGYDDNSQQFTVHDVGTQFGAYFKYSYDLLLDSIHDWPESGIKEDINQGEKSVLVLLK